MRKSDCTSVSEKVFWLMLDYRWWTFWQLQEAIKDHFGGKFYGEPTISAAIREIRKKDFRMNHGIPNKIPDPVLKRSLSNGSGYQYSLDKAMRS